MLLHRSDAGRDAGPYDPPRSQIFINLICTLDDTISATQEGTSRVARHKVERAFHVRLHGKEFPVTRFRRVEHAFPARTNLQEATVASRLDSDFVVGYTMQGDVLLHVAIVGQATRFLGSERVLQIGLHADRVDDDRRVERDLGQVHGREMCGSGV